MSIDMSGHTVAKCCMWAGGDGTAAMGEVGRCPRERPAPGPEAARIASVAIGDVAAESMDVEVRGEPGLAAGEGAEVAAGVPFSLAVARVVVLVTEEGSRMREGKKAWAGKRASCRVVSFVQRCTFRGTVSTARG